MPAQFSEDVQSIATRQHQIQQDQIVSAMQRRAPTTGRIHRSRHREAFQLEAGDHA